jgi:hypothetical protein
MYSHHSDHMQAEFDRIRRTIQWAIAHSDTLSEGKKSVSSTTPTLDSVGAHIRAISGDNSPSQSERLATDAIHSELAEMANRIESDVAAARSSGVYLRLDSIRRAFGLSRAELDTILLALAPAFDESVPGQYGELRDLDQPSYPTVSLLESLLVLMGHGREESETTPPSVSLSPASPLFEYDILQRYSEGPASPPTEDIVTVDDRIIQYLKGDDTLDPALDGVATVERADLDRSELVFDDETTEALTSIDERSRTADAPTIFYFWGEDGTGTDRLPAALTEIGTPVLRAEAEDVLRSEERLTRLIREAALRGASIHLEDLEAVTESEETPTVDAADDESAPIRIEETGETPSIDDIVERLDDAPGDVFLSHTESWTPDVDISRHRLETCECPFPEQAVRRAIWEAYEGEFADEDLVDHIATNFRLPQRDIRRATRTARYLCRTGADPVEFDDVDDIDELAASNGTDVFAPVDGNLTREHLYEACKRYSASNLETLAEQLDPGYGWDDISPSTTARSPTSGSSVATCSTAGQSPTSGASGSPAVAVMASWRCSTASPAPGRRWLPR